MSEIKEELKELKRLKISRRKQVRGRSKKGKKELEVARSRSLRYKRMQRKSMISMDYNYLEEFI